MDDGWRPAVQEVEALEDLATPVLQHLHVDLLEAFYVPGRNGNDIEIMYECTGHVCASCV